MSFSLADFAGIVVQKVLHDKMVRNINHIKTLWDEGDVLYFDMFCISPKDYINAGGRGGDWDDWFQEDEEDNGY